MSSPRSTKRRRIVASFNPLDKSEDASEKNWTTTVPVPQPKTARSASPSSPPLPPKNDDEDISSKPRESSPPPRSADNPPNGHGNGHEHESEPRATKFRFKSSSRRHHRSSRHSTEHTDPADETAHRHHHRRHGHSSHTDEHKSRHRRRRSHSPSRTRSRLKPPQPLPADKSEPEDPFSTPLDPEAAFRESLFDAMADDEGAAYWEGVYGQPIHVYQSVLSSSMGGTLERMTDDEYAAYVRQRMWEKTHAGLVEERARREKQRAADQRKRDEDARVQAEMDRSLRRGEERRRKRACRDAWERYVAAWVAWEGGEVAGIPWPGGFSGDGMTAGEMEPEKVRAFFANGLGREEIGEAEFAARLKEERVRWHPDKMQQRLGGTVDGAVMRDVTAIFQIVDGLWNDTRERTAG
ncbi:hypothetical protein B0T22DRAFT_446886 [Podospora appendiculata]|uniref:Uncharacterized protein n=1 Tax=Podospora appendiculata TaxID=314037 RepID=A0AAE0XF98_9PEZI|nr:hypothetical protein B0T22DRAFT_446886 [Podospora appendiculata]